MRQGKKRAEMLSTSTGFSLPGLYLLAPGRSVCRGHERVLMSIVDRTKISESKRSAKKPGDKINYSPRS